MKAFFSGSPPNPEPKKQSQNLKISKWEKMGKAAHSTCVEVNIVMTVFTHVTATENERS